MKRLLYWATLFALTTSGACSSSDSTDDNNGSEVRLTSQSEVNAFQRQGYVDLLIINGEDITDLSSLAITDVGTLAIQKTSIQSLSLPTLRSVAKEFTIENNSRLTAIADLSSLSTVNGTLTINNNTRLTDISGLLSLEKISGLLSITNNTSLGEDKPFDGGDDYTYGLLPVKYLSEHDALPGGVKLVNNHPYAATEVDMIGTGGIEEWQDFVIDSKAAADAFNPGGSTVMNLTVKGHEITTDVLISLTEKGLRCVKGIMTLEDTKITGTEGFFDVVKCEGSIIFKDNIPDEGQINTNGLRYYTRIGGDLVIENTRLVFWTNASSFASITDIAGSLRIMNCGDFGSGEGFESLKTVGGDLEISQCGNFSSLSGMKLITIGGSLLVTGNGNFNGLGGLESIQQIGGTVKLQGDLPDYGDVGRPGWCLVQKWISEGFIADQENMELKNKAGDAVSLEGIEPCDGNNPGGANEPKSYEINGLSELEAFVSAVPVEKETVVDLTISGSDITNDMMSRVQNRVAAITGTVTWDGVGVETTENFFNVIDCQGSIILRNCLNLGNPNGFVGYTEIKGDFIIENCPNLATPGAAGWGDVAWSSLEHVGGTVRLQGVMTQLGGPTFKRLQTVGGNFEIIECSDAFWDFKNMPLASVGGSIIIMNNPNFENLVGLDQLTFIGGDVMIVDNPKVPITSDWAVGYCLLRDYLTRGILSPEATITIGTTENPIDIATVPSCSGDPLPSEPQSYVLNGRTMVEAFINGASATKETVVNLTISGSDVTDDILSRVQDRVSEVLGTATWDGLAATTTVDFFDKINCHGIVIRDCQDLGNPNGFDGYTQIEGDFIIENCPNLATPGSPGWDRHGWWYLEHVGGTFRLMGVKQQMGQDNTFHSLKTVGGNFEIIECSDAFWNFIGMPLTSIGGDLIVTGNPNLETIEGLDKLEKIGGDVVMLDNPKVPYQASDWQVGLCIFKHYKDTGIIGPDATITLGMSDNLVNVDDLIPCTGKIKE